MKKVLLFLMLCLAFGSCSRESAGDVLNETLWVRHDGADMPAYIHGNGKSNTILVVIHGAGSFGLSFRDGGFVDELEKLYTVVYFDQRGQSMSQGHYDKPEDVIETMASDVDALLDALRYRFSVEDRFFLMGHSLGGLITGKAMLDWKFQDKLIGWINVDGLMDLPNASKYRQERIMAIAGEQIGLDKHRDEWQDLNNEIKDLDPYDDANYNKILQAAASCNKLLTMDGDFEQKNGSQRLYNAIIENNPLSWMISNLSNKPINYAIENDYFLIDQLDKIQIPVLFIYGKYDVSVPFTSGIDALNAIGSSEKDMALFEESMHHPFYTEPEIFSKTVKDFIESH